MRFPDFNQLTHEETDALIRALWAQVQALTAQVQTLVARVADLKARLGAPPKTPDNSILPPSRGQTPNRPGEGQAPRPAPGQRGQRGQRGQWTVVGRDPRRDVSAKPVRCVHCQASLGEADQVLHGRCDKTGLPQVAPVVTRVERCAGRFRRCGATTLAPVPEGLEWRRRRPRGAGRASAGALGV